MYKCGEASQRNILKKDLLKEGQNFFFGDPPDYKKAKACFEQFVKLVPQSIEGHLWHGSACCAIGDFKQAIEAYRAAINCNTIDPRPRIALWRILIEIGRPKDAIEQLEKGIQLKPHYAEADARLFLATAYEKANQIGKAIEQWQIVETMTPSYPSDNAPIREAAEKLRKHLK